jgi:hypothetical protein
MLLDFKGAAAYIGFSIDYLRYLKKRGDIPFIQPSGKNGKIFFEIKDLDKWLSERKKKAHQPQ